MRLCILMRKCALSTGPAFVFYESIFILPCRVESTVFHLLHQDLSVPALICTTEYKLYEDNIVEVNMDIIFETVCCAVSGVTPFFFISSSVHKCWIAVARVIVFVYGSACIYVHSCQIKAAVLGWGECREALKDILMTAVCEGWASPELPPACPLDYFAISPHALAESLGDIRASISHTAALSLPPTTTPLCFASRSHCK